MNFPKREEVLAAARFLMDAIQKHINGIAWYDWAEDDYDEPEFYVKFGESKGVVFLKESTDWVVKAPIPGLQDHCRMEAENWIRAKREGVAYAFAPCFYYGRFHGTPIYIQRSIQTDGDETSHRLYLRVSAEKPIGEEEDDDDYITRIFKEIDGNLQDSDRLSVLIGEDQRLFDFVNKYQINDLHEGNFGFLNGKIVVFDYSGFHEEMEG